ncbi:MULTISPECIES: hemagglutinin repeat-containing protein [unclassified Bartonella]|uniref:hemagglutinin repeat-containing protein n=1 Tax=unclassified Bartonella TaxID=2645622 RepID=UPI0035CEB2F6
MESGFLNEKSSHSSETYTTTISSILEATGKIDMDVQENAAIIASHLISGQNINVMGASVTIVGMTDHHSSHSQMHETGFGVGSEKSFVLIYGCETKVENEESFEHQDSSCNVDGNINITIKKKDVSVVGFDLAGEDY